MSKQLRVISFTLQATIERDQTFPERKRKKKITCRRHCTLCAHLGNEHVTTVVRSFRSNSVSFKVLSIDLGKVRH